MSAVSRNLLGHRLFMAGAVIVGRLVELIVRALDSSPVAEPPEFSPRVQPIRS